MITKNEKKQALIDMKAFRNSWIYALIVLYHFKKKEMNKIPVFIRYLVYFSLLYGGSFSLSKNFNKPDAKQKMHDCVNKAWKVGHIDDKAYKLLILGIKLIFNKYRLLRFLILPTI